MNHKKEKGSGSNVSLTAELEKLVEGKVKSGLYQTKSEVVREGLRLLVEHDKLREMRLEELRREIKIGLDQANRGELLSGEEVFRELKEKGTVMGKSAPKNHEMRRARNSGAKHEEESDIRNEPNVNLFRSPLSTTV